MAKNSKELKEERRALVADYRALIDGAEADKRALTPEENDKLDGLKLKVDEMDKKIQRSEFMESEEKRQAAIDDLEKRSNEQGGEGKEARSAFIQYLRGGMSSLSEEQRSLLLTESRATGMQVGSTTQGGVLVNKELAKEVVQALKDIGGFINEVTILTTATGGDLLIPTIDDTATKATIVSELTASTAGDKTLGSKTLKAYTYRSALIPVSFEILQDSAFDVLGLLANLIATSIWRAINEHFTIGTGTSQPTGITTCTKGADAAAAAITYQNLVDLEASIDPAYRPNAKWMMNSLTLAKLKSLVDTTGRPLFQPALSEGTPATLLGYPIVLNPDMPSVATGKKSIVFGDLKKAYYVRQVQGIATKRLDERLADQLAVGFFGWARFDGTLVLDGAVKHLLHA